MKLSACMIVKNEEKLLPQCLDSIKDYIDEIIIVDTGSTDKTMDIACKYGAKIYEHPWQDDFAFHRNQAFGYATGDWMLVIDPDEQLAPMIATKEELKERFANLPDDVYALLFTVRNKDQAGKAKGVSQSLRFFRNGIGIKYENYIHNRVLLPRGGYGAPSDFVIYHYGYYLDKEIMEKKFNRTSTLLHKRLNENPNDYEACYFLCNLFAEHGKLDKIIEYGQRALNLLPQHVRKDKKAPFNSLYHTMGMALCTRYNGDETHVYEGLRWIMEGLTLFPENIDLNYDVVHVGKIFNDEIVTDDMRRYGEKYLELYDLYTNNPHLAFSQVFMTLNEECKNRIVTWLSNYDS
jgi:glycosyltransferase involved in cell wall biosynthesis